MTTATAAPGNGKQETALATIPQTERGIITRATLDDATNQRALLSEYVQKNMVKGTDYGRIPGTDKDALLKPGAEKLVDLFRCTPQFELLERTEDYDKPLFAYMFRVRLYQRDAAVVLAEGYGSANSREGRYRWRNGQRLCPSCGKAAIIKGKAEYGGGWVCFKKQGGCNAKFNDNDPKIEGQQVGRVENDDVATLANTILKMAKKRALVDGAIALARVSDLFTQDVDEEHEKPPSLHTLKLSGVAEEVLGMAKEYGFDTGEKNAALWVLCREVTTSAEHPKGKPSKDWGDEEFTKIEAALAKAVSGTSTVDAEHKPFEEENDIPF